MTRSAAPTEGRQKGMVRLMEPLRASSQYGDLKGTATADYRQGMFLKDLGMKHGFDAETWTPVALSVLRFESGKAKASIIAVSRADYPEDHDTLVSKMEELDWKPRMTQFKFDVTLDEAFEIFKTFHVVLVRRGFDRLVYYEADDTVDLDDK